jgi:CheY-like chemotaxis protein
MHVPEALQQITTAESEPKFRILVVDDSAANRKLTMWMLGQLGYVADAAGNGCEALEAIERGSFDLILMDCRMPEMDGYEATRQIRRRGRHVKIVAMTAHALPDDERKRFDAGMDDYMSKPLEIEDLAAVLDRVRGRHCGGVGPGTPKPRRADQSPASSPHWAP